MAVGGGKNVNVELTASVGGFVRGFKSALGSLGRFKSRLGAGLGAIGGVVKSLAKYAAIGVGAITALTVAAGYMAIKMVKGNQEVEAALGEMASLGFTALDKLRQAAVDWTNSWGGDAAEFIRSSYAIKSAISTLTDDAVAEFARLAALTAAATKATVGDMTDLFASAYGTYKQNYKSMSDMDFGKMLSGGIAGAVQAFNTNGPKMKRALEALGSAATIAGQKMEEQFAILGTLQRTMQPGVAGTAYRAFISGAAKGIEMLRKEIDTLSKSKSAADKKEVASLKKLLAGMVDKEGRLRSTADILEAVREKYGDVIDTAEQVQIEKMFGGMEGFKLVAELIKDIGALRKNTADMAKAMGGGTKKTEEMADAMKTGKMKAEAFWSSLKNLKDEFAKGYSGVYEDMLERVRLKLVAAQKPAKEWAAKAKVWWAEHKDAALAYVDKGLKAVEDAWPKMQAKAEAALDWLKKNIPIAFGKLKSALTTIKDVGVEIAGAIVPIAKTLAVWATYDPATFGLALVVTAIVALFGGPAGLAALVALLSFKLGEAAGKADGLKGKLTEMLSTFATEIETSGWEEALLGPFARLPENLNKALTGVADELAAWAAQQTWFEDMMNGIDSVVEGVSGLLEPIKKVAEQFAAWLASIEPVKKVLDAIQQIATKLGLLKAEIEPSVPGIDIERGQVGAKMETAITEERKAFEEEARRTRRPKWVPPEEAGGPGEPPLPGGEPPPPWLEDKFRQLAETVDTVRRALEQGPAAGPELAAAAAGGGTLPMAELGNKVDRLVDNLLKRDVAPTVEEALEVSIDQTTIVEIDGVPVMRAIDKERDRDGQAKFTKSAQRRYDAALRKGKGG